MPVITREQAGLKRKTLTQNGPVFRDQSMPKKRRESNQASTHVGKRSPKIDLG